MNRVTGHAYDPHNLVVKGGVDDGYLAFNIPNAIEFGINSDGISVITELNCTFNTRKVLILAAHIAPIESGIGLSNTRVAMGTAGSAAVGDSACFSLSFASGMHAQIDTVGNEAAGERVTTGLDTTKRIQHFGVPKTIFCMWNGIGSSASVAGTLTAECLNEDGTVYNDGPDNITQTVTGLLTADSFKVGDMMRPAWSNYYKMEAWQLDYLPKDLRMQLKIWGDLARAGHKGAVVFR